MSELTEITETAEDTVLEAVEEPEVGPEEPKWHKHVTLTTLIMALLAALGGLLAGMTANQALLDRTEEIMGVSRLESERAYVETLKSKHEILTILGETPDPSEVAAVAAFEDRMGGLVASTAEDESEVHESADAHEIFAVAVTLLALGITLGGMAIVVERKLLWTVGLTFGALGTIGIGLGVLTMLS